MQPVTRAVGVVNYYFSRWGKGIVCKGVQVYGR